MKIFHHGGGFWIAGFCTLCTAFSPIPSAAVDVKIGDIARVQGMRENALLGYGLVVGLAGTGDSRYSQVTTRSMANMLEKFGLNLSKRDFASQNSAAVMVSATLPAFAREGDRLDIHIASIGDARSLQGGTLLLTPLFAGNQEVYATAQGPVSVGGYYVQSGNQQIKKNITTSGVISGGAIVERGVGGELVKENKITLSLDQQDFGLAQQVKKSLDNLFGQGTAQTPNSAEIVLTLPEKYGDDPVAFVAEALAATVTSPDNARVVVDERTGTVVVGGEVKISKVAVSHGGLHIAIAGETKVFQPAPFSLGQSVVAEQLSLRADERAKEMVALPEGTTIEELVRALNALGTLPRDTIVILENIRAAGALHARIISR